MRGRKPQPTALKILKGTRADRINRNEPKKLDEKPQKSELLDAHGQAEWDRIVPKLEAMGVLFNRRILIESILHDIQQMAQGTDHDRPQRDGPEVAARRPARESVRADRDQSRGGNGAVPRRLRLHPLEPLPPIGQPTHAG
jgi:hypothetical protein